MFNLLAIIILFLIKANIAYGFNNNLLKASKTTKGIEYIDMNSLMFKDKGGIKIKTRYLKLDDYSSLEIEYNIY